MFEGKARRLPKSGAPERCFTREGSGLTCELDWKGLSGSNLFKKSVNYGCESFITLSSGGLIRIQIILTLDDVIKLNVL